MSPLGEAIGKIMDIKFTCRCNYGSLLINKAIFCLSKGTRIGVDRKVTATSDTIKPGEVFTLTFHNAYLWDLNGYNIFGTGSGDGFHLLNKCYEAEFAKMLWYEKASCFFEYEDEAAEDYEVEVLDFEVVADWQIAS